MEEFLEYIYQFFSRAIMMCTVSVNQSKIFRFPENHWVVRFLVFVLYPTTFLQLGVYVHLIAITLSYKNGKRNKEKTQIGIN